MNRASHLFQWTENHLISLDSVAEIEFVPKGTRQQSDRWTENGPIPNLTTSATLALKLKHRDEWLSLSGDSAEQAWQNMQDARDPLASLLQSSKDD